MVPVIFALLSGVFAALVAIFAKLGFNDQKVDTTVATTIRSLIMFVFLAGIAVIAGKFRDFDFKIFTGKDWLYIVLSGIAGGLSWLFYFIALQNGKTVTIVSLDRLSVAFAAIFAYFLLQESLGWKEIIGIVLMVAGAILISLK